MRFLVLGAGALGGYFGGMLLRGGAEVDFLVRPKRAAQLAERGLVIKDPAGDFTTPVKTLSAGDIDGPYEIVFLACKAYDLDRIEAIAPAVGAERRGVEVPILRAALCNLQVAELRRQQPAA